MGYVSQAAGVKGFDRFGDQASRMLISQVSMLPASQRARNLQLVLEKIDPSLWTRSQAITKRMISQGVKPAAATQKGIARAMSSGLAAEIVKMGQTGKVSTKGLAGLGAFGKESVYRRHRGAFGGLGAVASAVLDTVKATAAVTNPFTQPDAGMCDTTGQYIWTITGGVGAWVRKKASQTCVGTWTGGTITQGTNQGGITVTNPDGSIASGPSVEEGAAGPHNVVASDNPLGALQMMQVGPFTVPLGAELTIHWSGLLPLDWISFIATELSQDCHNCLETSMVDATEGHTYGALRDFLGDSTPTRVNHDLVAIGTAKKKVAQFSFPIPQYQFPDQPIAQCVRPDNGEKWGFFLNIVQRDVNKPWDSTTNPYVAVIAWRKCPVGVWDFIKTVVGTIIDWVGDALDALGGMACDLMKTDVGQAGAVVAGAVVGAYAGGPKGAQVGAAVGGAGGAAAKAACTPTQECPAGTIGIYPQCVAVSTTPSWLLPVALGGAGLLVVLAMSKKKKKKASTAP